MRPVFCRFGRLGDVNLINALGLLLNEPKLEDLSVMGSAAEALGAAAETGGAPHLDAVIDILKHAVSNPDRVEVVKRDAEELLIRLKDFTPL